MPAKTTSDTFEGFGIVYIEAAGYGIPCIGTNDSGAAEAIEEGVSGYKCDPTNGDDIVAAMENILMEHTINRSACRQWAEKHTATTMVSAIESLYQTLT
jgi:phosphatidylinositol alpha-1,6-mannosyltransferase